MTLLEFNQEVQKVAIKYFGNKCSVNVQASVMDYKHLTENSFNMKYDCSIQPSMVSYPTIFSAYQYKGKELSSPEEAIEAIDSLLFEYFNPKPSVDIEL